jgi:cob(I)alamin adenosyltransferase
MKIYTKTGDAGMTSLSDGSRVYKSCELLDAYGTVDELNAFIGVLISKERVPFLEEIQQKLFVVGGMLATPLPLWEKYWKQVDLDAFVEDIEHEIDAMSAQLPPWKGFILPQGNEVIATAHVCRTVCRRAERNVVALMASEEAYNKVQKVLNRLSDYFFILARFFHVKYQISETYYVSVK